MRTYRHQDEADESTFLPSYRDFPIVVKESGRKWIPFPDRGIGFNRTRRCAPRLRVLIPLSEFIRSSSCRKANSCGFCSSEPGNIFSNSAAGISWGTGRPKVAAVSVVDAFGYQLH